MKTLLTLLPDMLMIAGGAVTSCGIAMVYLPAGVTAAGLFLLAAAVLIARGQGK